MKFFLNFIFFLTISIFLLFPFIPQGLVVFNLKLLILTLVVFLLLLHALINLVVAKKLVLTATLFDRPLFFLLIAFLLSTLFSNNMVFSFLSPTGGLTILVLVFWYYFLSGLMVSQKEKILKILIFSATIFSLFSLALSFLPSVIKLLPFKLPDLTNFSFAKQNLLVQTTFNSAYEPLSFLLPPALISGFYLFNFFKQKARFSKSVFLLIFSFLLLSGTVINLLPLPLRYNYSHSQVVILPHQFAYQVAIDTLKNPKEAILGFGPGNYNIALNLNRPAGLNIVENGKFSGLRFGSSSNLPFQLITETGILGILAWAALLWAVFKQTLLSLRGATTSLSSRSDEALLGFWTTILLSLLFPPSLTLWFYLFTFLAFLVSHSGGVKAKTWDFSVLGKGVWVIPGSLVFLISLTVYLAGRAYLADFYFQKSLQATAKNDKVVNVFSLQNRAINLNPYLPQYHQALSQTLLFWANAIPAQAQNQQLSDQDRQTISTLLQQSISQAQMAISLSPRNAFYWENLGLIYRGLIPVVNAADSWAVSSLSQSVLFDSNNPNTRFLLAGVFLQMQRFDEARQQLEITTALSPNFANGFYNLSFAQKNLKLYPQALASLNQAILLLPADSANIATVQKEKEELELLAKEATSTAWPKSPAAPVSPVSSSSAEAITPKLNLPQTASMPAHFKP